MMIGIAATGQQKEQLLLKGIHTPASVCWVDGTNELLSVNADVLIDCTFSNNQLPYTDKPFLFHSPVNTLAELGAKGRVGRFCAWNTFLERPLWEIAVTDSRDNTWVNMLTDVLGWKFCIVEDVPGLVAPRVVCNIINEACYALMAGISSRHEMDLAMKLGTNYPYGPFEWANKIGADNINSLLAKLTIQQSFYEPVTAQIL